MRSKHLIIGGMAVFIAAITSCRDIETVLPPKIEMEKTEFTVKTDRNLMIQPTVENADENAVYSWTLDNKVIGMEKDLIFKKKEAGIYFITFKVITKQGVDTKEIKVEVSELIPPIINLQETGDGFILETGEEFIFKPEIENKEGLKLSWIINEKEVSTASEYSFVSDKEGSFFITLKAENKDGEDEYLIKIFVTKSFPPKISFRYPEQSASLGRTIRIIPEITGARNTKFQWYVNGKEDESQTSSKFIYTPDAVGKTTVKVVGIKGNNRSEASIVINTVQPEQTFRPRFDGCNPKAAKLFEYTPAPGQFINTDGWGKIETAENLIKTGSGGVSLGGFGGYIVVGFDHSVENKGEYDLLILGNAFQKWSEPGIVWVMQDENGNGLPDDNWYELQGSETGKAETIQDYEVTYFRPSSSQANTLWIDNKGQKGYVEANGFHQQDYYYPEWIVENNYTLRGTRIGAEVKDLSGQGSYYVVKDYDWGYVDNYCSSANKFKISHAVTHDMKPIHLKYIDFVKVQCGVNATAGWLGEMSTEVLGFSDMHTK